MKRILISLFFGLFLFFSSNGQNYRVTLQAGYGMYDLESIKTMQSIMLNYYGSFPAKAVDKFPDYINYALSLEQNIGENWLTGISLGYYITGGRNQVRDYSGEYKLDMPLHGFRVGISTRYVVSPRKKLNYYGQMKVGYMFSTLKIKETLAVFNMDTVLYNGSNKSGNLFVEPSAGVIYNLNSKLSLDANIGYQFDINSSFLTKRESVILWRGLRFLLGLGYKF